MSNRLLDNISQIRSQKDEYIIPENIRNGVTIFGVTGTYGGGSGDDNFRLYTSYDELPSADSVTEGTIAVIGGLNGEGKLNVYQVYRTQFGGATYEWVDIGLEGLTTGEYNQAVNDTDEIIGDTPTPVEPTVIMNDTQPIGDTGVSVQMQVLYTPGSDHYDIYGDIINTNDEDKFMTNLYVNIINGDGMIFDGGGISYTFCAGKYAVSRFMAGVNYRVGDLVNGHIEIVSGTVEDAKRIFVTLENGPEEPYYDNCGFSFIKDGTTYNIDESYDYDVSKYVLYFLASVDTIHYDIAIPGYAIQTGDMSITSETEYTITLTPVSGESHQLTLKFHGDDQAEGEYMDITSIICYGPDANVINFETSGIDRIANVPYGLCNYSIMAPGYGINNGRFTMPDEDHTEVIILEKETITSLDAINTEYENVTVGCNLKTKGGKYYASLLITNQSDTDYLCNSASISFSVGADSSVGPYSIISTTINVSPHTEYTSNYVEIPQDPQYINGIHSVDMAMYARRQKIYTVNTNIDGVTMSATVSEQPTSDSELSLVLYNNSQNDVIITSLNVVYMLGAGYTDSCSVSGISTPIGPGEDNCITAGPVAHSYDDISGIDSAIITIYEEQDIYTDWVNLESNISVRYRISPYFNGSMITAEIQNDTNGPIYLTGLTTELDYHNNQVLTFIGQGSYSGQTIYYCPAGHNSNAGVYVIDNILPSQIGPMVNTSALLTNVDTITVEFRDGSNPVSVSNMGFYEGNNGYLLNSNATDTSVTVYILSGQSNLHVVLEDNRYEYVDTSVSIVDTSTVIVIPVVPVSGETHNISFTVRGSDQAEGSSMTVDTFSVMNAQGTMETVAPIDGHYNITHAYGKVYIQIQSFGYSDYSGYEVIPDRDATIEITLIKSGPSEEL